MEEKKTPLILFLHENVTNGGGEKMFRWLGQSLKERGYEIRYLFVYDNPEIDISNLDADCLGLPIEKSYLYRNFRYFTIGAYAIYNYLKRNEIKYVVSFGTNSFYFLEFYKKILGFKILVSERADPHFKRFGWLRKWLFSKADLSVFQTPGARAFFSKNSEERTYIIPNPVKIPTFLWDDDKTDNTIISVGRIDFEHKRQDVLLKAFSIIHEQLPDYKLKIVGSGFDMNKLISMIDDMGLKDSVFLLGQQKDVFSHLLSSKLFVLTSEFEGIPNVLLEAMAIGMPVVSTDCSPGGAAFLLGQNQNGILVQRGDYRSIAEKSIALLNNRESRKNFGEKARSSVMKFSEEKIIEKWINVINILLKV